ncbi:MAG: hypothetical protein AAGJ80_10475, partial [Cyanobacteria bacterium J06553_1]
MDTALSIISLDACMLPLKLPGFILGCFALNASTLTQQHRLSLTRRVYTAYLLHSLLATQGTYIYAAHFVVTDT